MTQSMPGTNDYVCTTKLAYVQYWVSNCDSMRAALLFTLVGFSQMAQWALRNHRNYCREFKNYPPRKAIVPFLL